MSDTHLTDLVPRNWLDPILSGPSAVIRRPPYDCDDIDRILDAVRLRIGAAPCPHCHLPPVMPNPCTPEVHAVLQAQIDADKTLYEAGWTAGQQAHADEAV